MKKLKDRFSDLTYSEVQQIAEQFNFSVEGDLPKYAFDEALAEFIIDNNHQNKLTGFEAFSDDDAKQQDRINLFPYQVTHKKSMVQGFYNGITFLNASETGTGKTYMTLSYAESSRRPLFVICPKSMLLEWYLLALKHRVHIAMICNYETLIRCKMYKMDSDVKLDNLKRIECPYVEKITEAKGRGKRVRFRWKDLPERALVVFDEAHYCKNVGTQRTALLTGLYDFARHPEQRWRNTKILLLSATIIEKKDNLRPFMYILGYANSPQDKTKVEHPDFSIREFGKKLKTERRMTRATMVEARAALNDNHTSDIRTKTFKLNEKDRAKIQELCSEIRNILTAGKEKRPKNHLAKRLNLRQQIEALKLGIMFSELKSLREKGYSVVIFVNFKNSLTALKSLVKEQMAHEPFSVIVGGQSASERLKEVERFQEGETNVLLSMIGAGGVGISLHDTKGGRPRYSLISPPESATQTIQAIGRLDRIGSKTDSVQRIIFVADTIEDKIAESLERKIRTIGDLNDDTEADNLFLYEVYHEYEPHNPEIDSGDRNDPNDTISIKIDKVSKKILVTVPGYMVDAFESNIPPQASLNMRLSGDHYIFPLKHYNAIREYLSTLNI